MYCFAFKRATAPILLVLVAAMAAAFPFHAVASTSAKPASGLPAAEPKANPPVFFAHTRSDIRPDPRARFGKLANGMTYIVYKNAVPPGTANIVMRVNAGSLMEREDQRGLAHFIEHMVFKGTTHVPEGEMVKLLERNGLKFGADTNAYTSHKETGYTLKLPNVKQQTLDESLFLLREAASNVLFDQQALDSERGVVLGEERSRGGVQTRANDAQAQLMFAGQKYPVRMPIGLTEVIRTAPRQALVDFYDNFYRPEYTTLVVVGDIDPDRIERDIKARFSDWKGKPQTADALTDFGVYKPKGEVVRTYAEKGLSDQTTIDWFKPFKARIETRRRDYEETLYSIAFGILARRFDRQSKQADAAFSRAQFSKGDVPYTVRNYELGFRPKPKQNKAAFEQTMATFRQFLAYGVTQAELDRQLVSLQSGYDASVAAQGTRPSGAIIGSLLSSVSMSVPTTPVQNLAAFRAMRPKLKLQDVNAFIQKIDLGDGPIIFRQAEDASDFDEAQLQAAYSTAMQRPTTPYVGQPEVAWAYTDFGPPGQVVDRQTLPDIGVTRVGFANGVKLSVKPTTFEKNSVLVSVVLAGGYLPLPPEKATVVFVANNIGLLEGGLGRLARDELSVALNGKSVMASFGIGETASSLSGSTTATDLTTQMQLLMAFQTDAAFRPDALERLKTGLPDSFARTKTSPAGVYGQKAAPLLYGNEPFHRQPSEQAMMSVTNDEVKALVKGILANAPIEITMVGDVSADEAIKQVAATFGTLPKRPDLELPLVSSAMHFPTEGLRQVFTHEGRADQNLSVIAWPTTDFYSDTRRATGLNVLAAILGRRELDEVRSHQGASYGATASNDWSGTYVGFSFMESKAEVKPEVDDAYFQTVGRIADDLKAKPPTDDEMLRAKGPMLEQLVNEQNHNWYWLSLLENSIHDPRNFEFRTKHQRAALEAVTAQDVQALAKTYLDMSKAMRIQVKAADENAAAPGAPGTLAGTAASAAAR